MEYYVTLLIAWLTALANLAAGLKFIDEPVNVVVVQDQPFSWNCIAESTDTISYSWKKNEVELVNDDIYTVMPNGTLRFSTVGVHEMGALFMCAASAEGSTIYSHQIMLQPAFLDTFLVNPESQTAVVATQVTMTCEINSSPPATIRWTLFADPVPEDMYTMMTSSKSQLTIQSADYVNVGKYFCIASNQLLNKIQYSLPAELTVVGRPAFQQEPLPQSITVSGTAVFHCLGIANPALTLTWNREDADGNVVPLVSDGIKYTIMENGTMKISPVANEDAGFYTCILTNLYGQNSKTVLLSVTEPLSLPTFTNLSPDKTVMENESVTLECQATGKPLPSITWSKEYGSLPINRVIYPYPGIMTITGARADDQAIYVCTAENKQGSKMHRVLLTVQVGPSVLVSPKEVVVKPSEQVILTCQTSGEPRPTVQWNTPNSGIYPAPQMVRDGISVASDGTLTIFNALSKHHGKYACMASNKVSMISKFAFVNVEGSPWFTQQPYNQGVIEGDGALLQCRAAGYPAPTITWRKDGSTDPLSSSSKYQLLPGGDLLIETTTPADEGVYRCMASNSEGDVEATARLKILVPPLFTKVMPDMLVQVGDNLSLDCVITAVPEPNQWWEKSGKSLVIESNMVLYPNFTLVFTGITQTQLGTYDCVGQNQAGTKKDSVLIFTIDMPVIITKPVNMTVNETGTINIACEATAEKMPTISWFSGEIGSASQVKLGIDPDSRFTVTEAGTLVITDLVEADMGWYVCQAENYAGKTNASMYIRVQVPPKNIVTNSPQRIQRQAGVTLMCKADGDPIPTMQWVAPSGNALQPDILGYIQERSDLIIDAATEEKDGGIWTCTACNMLGCLNGNVELIIEGKPIIRSIETSKNDTHSTLYCVPTGFPNAILSYYVDGQLVSPDTVGHAVQNNALTIDVTNTGIEYGCTASNRYGEDTRNVSAPTSVLTGVQGEITSATAATVTWTPETTLGNLTVLSYNVYSRLEAGTDWSMAGTVTSPSYTVTGLLPFSTYVFSVTARTVLGDSPNAETDPVQTMESVPSAPLNLAATQMGEKTCQVTWDPPDMPNGDPTHLAYRLKMTNQDDSFQAIGNPAYSDTQTLVTALHWGPYVVKLWAVNTLLNAESQPAVTEVYIKEIEPGNAPVITDIHTQSSRQIKVTWNTTSAMDVSKIDGFVLSVQEEKVDDEPVTIRVPIETTDFMFDSLKPNTNYLVKVAAYNSGGVGPFSESYPMTTPAEPEPQTEPEPELELALPWPYIVIITVCLFAFVCFFVVAVIVAVKLSEQGKKDSVSLVKPRHLSERFYLNPNIEGNTNSDFSMY